MARVHFTPYRPPFASFFKCFRKAFRKPKKLKIQLVEPFRKGFRKHRNSFRIPFRKPFRIPFRILFRTIWEPGICPRALGALQFVGYTWVHQKILIQPGWGLYTFRAQSTIRGPQGGGGAYLLFSKYDLYSMVSHNFGPKNMKKIKIIFPYLKKCIWYPTFSH